MVKLLLDDGTQVDIRQPSHARDHFEQGRRFEEQLWLEAFRRYADKHISLVPELEALAKLKEQIAAGQQHPYEPHLQR